MLACKEISVKHQEVRLLMLVGRTMHMSRLSWYFRLQIKIPQNLDAKVYFMCAYQGCAPPKAPLVAMLASAALSQPIKPRPSESDAGRARRCNTVFVKNMFCFGTNWALLF